MSGPRKEFVYVVFGQVLNAFGTIAVVYLLTKYIPINEFGSFTLALTLTGFFGAIVFSGPSGAAVKMYSEALQDSSSLAFIQALKSSSLSRFLLMISASSPFAFIAPAH